MAEKEQLRWTGRYHRGQEHVLGIWKGRDEATAMKVATRWCEFNGYRPPAKLWLEVLADESILLQEVPRSEEPIPDEIQATTGANVAKTR